MRLTEMEHVDFDNYLFKLSHKIGNTIHSDNVKIVTGFTGRDKVEEALKVFWVIDEDTVQYSEDVVRQELSDFEINGKKLVFIDFNRRVSNTIHDTIEYSLIYQVYNKMED